MDDGAVPAPLSRDTLKRAATIVGSLLCLFAAALLVRRGLALGTALGDRLLQIPPLAFAAALALYVVGALLLGVSWVTLVRLAAGTRPRARPLFVTHLRAQLAKYLPGNVFHFAWRHLAARQEGVGHRALAGALVLESILLIAAAAVLACGVVADPRLEALAPWARDLVRVAPWLALVAWLGLGVAASRLGLADMSLRRAAPAWLGVAMFDLAFFVLAGSALRLLSDQPSALPFGGWCGWLALAWVAGYVVPGAPAGLGLREAVLALGLTPALGAAEALALALAYRLLTVVADALLAALGFVLKPALRGEVRPLPPSAA